MSFWSFTVVMWIVSLNCRGLGTTFKKDGVGDLIKQEKLTVLGLQETKLDSVDMPLVQSLLKWISLLVHRRGFQVALCLHGTPPFLKRKKT